MKMIGHYQPSGFAAHERGTEQNPKSIINLKKAIAVVLLLVAVFTGYAQVDGDYRSKSTPVNWGAAASWQVYSGGSWIDASVYPGQGAGAGTVTIQDGHTVALNVSNTLANAIGALVVGQGASGTLTGDAVTNRNLFITNGLTVSTGATFTLSRVTMTVGGNTSVSGTLSDNNLNGNMTFTGSFTVNNGGTFSNTSTSAMVFRNGLANNGTFSTSGAVSFTTNPQSIDGTNPITIAGTVTVTGITVTNNSPSLTLSSTGNPSLTGTGEFEQGVNSLLRFNGSSMNNASLTLDFTATGNKVVYYRNNTQTIAGTTYYHLVDSVSNTKTLGGNVTVNGDLAIKGTATLACSMYQITGNATGTFTMESGTTLRLGNTTDPTDVLFPTNFTNANITLSGTSTVHYQNNSAQTVSHVPDYRNLTIATSGSTKTATGPLNVALALLVNTGATLTTAGNLTVGTTLTVATSGGTLNMDASATTLSVAGAVSIPGTLNLGTNLTTATFGSTCAVAGSLVFDGTSTKTVSITGNLSGAGSIDMSGGALPHHLILGGASNAITTFTTAASSTVTYERSGAQSMINSSNYRNLIIRNSGLKSCTATLVVAEDFTIDSLASFNPGGNAFTVSGNTLLYYGTFADNSATNTNSFQDVELNGGVISGSQTGIVNINGNLSVLSGNGTIGRAAVTVSGTTTIATGRLLDLTNTNGAKTFNGLISVQGTGRFRSTTLNLVTHLLLGGGVDVEASGGQFTAGGATFTVSQSLESAGTLSFGNATTINSGVTVVNRSSQGITLTGTLNGVDGSSIWMQGANSVAFYRSATAPMVLGVLTADSTGNFWHYNASAAQAVKGTTYYNLTCSGGGNFAKTLQAGANVDGAFQLDTLTLFNPVNYSMTISGPSTITGTIGDSNSGGAIDFEDVNLSGGTIHHASSNGTFRINGNLTMPSSNGTIGRGIVTVYGTTTINNGRTLTLSTNNAGLKNFIGKITLNGSGIFNSSAITTASNLDIEGGIDVTNVAGYFNAAAVLLSEDQDLEGEGEISFGAVTIASGITVRNYNRYRVEFNGVLNGGDISSTYVQEDSAVTYYQPAAATAPMVTGELDASGTGNVFHYCRPAGAQSIRVPLTAYHHITVSGGNTKSLSAGTTTANGKLRIESGTTLQVAGNTIAVGDSAIVDGTFDDNNSAGTNTFTGHLLVSGTGTLSTTTNSAFTFEGGFTNNNVFSKTGTGDITFSGSNQDINGTGETTLSGNITINTGLTITYKNTNSTGLTLNGILNGQTGTSTWVNDVNTTVNYTSSASANSPMATGLLDASGTGNTFNYNRAGAQTVKHPVDGYYNLSINGSGTKTLTGNTLIGGNLVIELGTTLDVDAAQNYAVAVNGNLLNSGIFAAQTGTITFSGLSNQIFDPSSSTFHNITIDMDATQLTLANDLTMNGTLTLTDGVVTTGSNTLILTSTNANSLVGFSSGSFVNGNLRRYITTNTSTYSFPVGNGTASSNYYRADLINNNLQGITYLDASFIPLDNHDNSEMVAVDNFQNGDLTYTGIHPAGVWRIEPDNIVDDGSYGMRLYTQNMAGLADNDFGPLKRPITSMSGADWTPGSGTLSNNDGDGRLVAHGYAIRTGWDSFSEFGVGHGSSSGSGLPIELVAFNAVAIGAAVEVTWQTATETNNEHFTVERSADGETFTAIAIVAGAGNSSEPLNYSEMDYTPLAGVSYYRLKQTDYNGDYTYSNVVSVNVNKEDLFTISPNPVTSGSRIVVRLNREELTGGAERVEVTDLSGKTVFTQLLGLTENPTLNLELPTNLSTGVYMVSIKCLNNTLQKKILVQ